MSPETATVPAARLWGGRFAAGPAPEMDRLNRSLPVDFRLWREDVAGSLAWAGALFAAGVISAGECAKLRAGLDRVAARLEEWGPADWAGAPDEDIHSLVERLLYEEAGSVAGKLHTGRSRNDQVATDARLWAFGAVSRLDAALRDLQRALLEQAERHVDTLMPAYTHLQRAQPVSAAHWLLSHAWPLARDRERLAQARERVAVLPLGSGAIAGCPFPVDRVLLKETLGFHAVSRNSIDAVADRDWVADLLYVASLVGVHLSRLGEDLVLFASSEWGFVRLSDRFSTGSSLMPQKRNPDTLELARGKAGRLIGDLTGFLTVLKGLPSGYNKDIQEDKEALFDAFDTLEALLPAVAGTVRTLELDAERCAAAVDGAMLATELADFLVRSGIPFREAHGTAGKLVRAAEEWGCGVEELPHGVFVEVSDRFAGADLGTLFAPEAALARRGGPGGTAPDAVREQITGLRALL
ncbi:MAG TPA: argininosuccinate lyase [Longimicrobiaceae bacterium]|nr:argininosuccinate lyase [Longimicrobiaceae bacterium]